MKREPDPWSGRPHLVPGLEGAAGSPQPGAGFVAISSLRPADSPRLAGVADDHVGLLAQAEAALPPILVHWPSMRVIDGMHRLAAAALRGQHTIEVEFFGGSDDDAFIRAVQENITHGLPLTLADRKAAAARILTRRPELSDRAVAARTGLSGKTIAALRRRSTGELPQSSARIGADGRLRSLSSAEGRRRAFDVITARPDASLRDIASAASVSVGTAHDVRTRMRRGENPLATHGRPAPRPAPAAAGPAPLPRTRSRDSQLILQNLMQDPSLRHTDTGRELLRWLRTHIITATEWPALASAVPPHCTEVVAELARQCADTWSQIAHHLEHRTQP
jgi:ParB-like chromosome segregation protein Spo0J